MEEIVILGKGCRRCDGLEERIRNVVREKRIDATIRHIRDLDQIASYGFIITPALLVNGKLKAAGKDLTEQELERILVG
jgi:small redox-active disulfide protein 2